MKSHKDVEVVAIDPSTSQRARGGLSIVFRLSTVPSDEWSQAFKLRRRDYGAQGLTVRVDRNSLIVEGTAQQIEHEFQRQLLEDIRHANAEALRVLEARLQAARLADQQREEAKNAERAEVRELAERLGLPLRPSDISQL